ncbi:glycosyltransferase family 1 protein [Kordiimonas sp. SCSIO 12603]|uniref:glycosyltransferase n=1 Tax=Kordiimonas sp. SCSIO 12603 TaxID=2829596 RepID=UPI002106096F|nr:glycosyltransferase [Kordiimonas sp. SCSIO 12603]UTW59806.1 glycosyltransferase family 1 protein [Kordiimonas sp. SCSIO 12603]
MSDAHPEKTFMDIPFGLNWGSFHNFVKDPKKERDIDVLLTFSESETTSTGPFRRITCELFNALQEKYGHKYNFVHKYGIPRSEYLELMQRAKISLNAVVQHGPYNYRAIESINSGAVLFQIRTQHSVEPQQPELFFEEGKEIEFFDETDFESKILNYLENPELIEQVRENAHHRIQSDYSYTRQYSTLVQQFIELSQTQIPTTLNNRPSPAKSRMHRALYLFHIDADFKFSHIITELTTLAEELKRPLASILLPVLPRLLKTLDAEAVYNFLQDDKITKAFKSSMLKGIEYTYSQIPQPDDIDDWNYLMAKAAQGDIDKNEATLLLERVRNTSLIFDEKTMLFSAHNPETFNGNLDHAEVQLKNYNFLLAGGNKTKRHETLQEYMAYCLEAIGAASMVEKAA